MIRNIYALRDSVAMKYRDLVCDDSPEEAKRNLAFQVNNNQQFAFFAKDLTFLKVGEFDLESGVITPIIPADVVCHVADLIGEK